MYVNVTYHSNLFINVSICKFKYALGRHIHTNTSGILFSTIRKRNNISASIKSYNNKLGVMIPMQNNNHHSNFPPPQSADEYGLVAVTQYMNTNLLLDAYYHGIFPWSEDPVRWYSPDPRAIFIQDRIKLPKKLGKIIRKNQTSF